jgi:hypothetical protein
MIATMNPYAWVPIAMVIWGVLIYGGYLAAVAYLHLAERGEASEEHEEDAP